MGDLQRAWVLGRLLTAQAPNLQKSTLTSSYCTSLTDRTERGQRKALPAKCNHPRPAALDCAVQGSHNYSQKRCNLPAYFSFLPTRGPRRVAPSSRRSSDRGGGEWGGRGPSGVTAEQGHRRALARPPRRRLRPPSSRPGAGGGAEGNSAASAAGPYPRWPAPAAVVGRCCPLPRAAGSAPAGSRAARGEGGRARRGQARRPRLGPRARLLEGLGFVLRGSARQRLTSVTSARRLPCLQVLWCAARTGVLLHSRFGYWAHPGLG